MAKKIIAPSAEELLSELLKIHVPLEYLKHFDLYEVRDKPDCYELILHEKETCIPAVLGGRESVILDGFCDPISILSHSFSLKKVYLVVRRRRWKITGGDSHYSNDYDLHPKGLKLTKFLAAFLKGSHRVVPG